MKWSAVMQSPLEDSSCISLEVYFQVSEHCQDRSKPQLSLTPNEVQLQPGTQQGTCMKTNKMFDVILEEVCVFPENIYRAGMRPHTSHFSFYLLSFPTTSIRSPGKIASSIQRPPILRGRAQLFAIPGRRKESQTFLSHGHSRGDFLLCYTSIKRRDRFEVGNFQPDEGRRIDELKAGPLPTLKG